MFRLHLLIHVLCLATMTPDMFNIKTAKILVTGGGGFLGNHVIKELLNQGVPIENLSIPRSKEHDLRRRNACKEVTKNIDLVLHLAGNVGGIGKNRQLPGKLFYDNAIMGIELIEAARQNRVKKFLCLGTICAYPKFTPAPFTEENLWTGYPEETNAPYGLAKKMLLVQAQSYRQQYGFNCIYLLPVNLYGPGDNFNPESSHVIPALIKKIADAKETNRNSIEVWGDGTPTREFLYVKDAARAIVLASIHYNDAKPVNLGSGFEISIRDLAEKIASILKFSGSIHWDKTKPNGQPRRLLDVSKAKQYFGFTAETPFEVGLPQTINWYLEHRKSLNV